MNQPIVGRARQVAVPADEPLIGGDRYDYADTFEIRLREPDPRPMEHFARFALEQGPWPVRLLVWVAHRYVLRGRLGPHPSPSHIFGWKIVTSEPDLIHIEAEGPVMRGVIVGRRVEKTRPVVTTYVFFNRPAIARPLFVIVAPLHRRVVKYLLERSAANAQEAVPA